MDTRRWNYSDLATHLRVSRSTVSRLMSGGTGAPSLETMTALAALFDKSIADVLAMSTVPLPAKPAPAQPDPDVAKLLRGDPHLRPYDRKLIVELYERLRQ